MSRIVLALCIAGLTVGNVSAVRVWSAVGDTNANDGANYSGAGALLTTDSLLLDGTSQHRWCLTDTLTVAGIHLTAGYDSLIRQNGYKIKVNSYFKTYACSTYHYLNDTMELYGNYGIFYVDSSLEDVRSCASAYMNTCNFNLIVSGNWDTLENRAYTMHINSLRMAFPECTTYSNNIDFTCRQTVYMMGGVYVSGAEMAARCMAPATKPFDITAGTIIYDGGWLVFELVESGTYILDGIQANSIFGACTKCRAGSQNLTSIIVKPVGKGAYIVNQNGNHHLDGPIYIVNSTDSSTLTYNVLDNSIFINNDGALVMGASKRNAACSVVVNLGSSIDTVGGVDFGRAFTSWPDSGATTLNMDSATIRVHSFWRNYDQGHPTINPGTAAVTFYKSPGSGGNNYVELYGQSLYDVTFDTSSPNAYFVNAFRVRNLTANADTFSITDHAGTDSVTGTLSIGANCYFDMSDADVYVGDSLTVSANADTFLTTGGGISLGDSAVLSTGRHAFPSTALAGDAQINGRATFARFRPTPGATYTFSAGDTTTFLQLESTEY